jgi:hypothetical protein
LPDRSPNYARLFAEAVDQSIRDYASDNPQEMHRLAEQGYWLIQLGKNFPPIPARVWWCDHEPGNPENKLDTPPYLAAEIAGEPVDPLDVYAAVERRPIDKRPLVPKEGLSVEQEYAYRVADLQHAQRWRPDDPLANPRRRVNLTRIAPIEPPIGEPPQ